MIFFPKICDVLLKTPLIRDIQFLLCHKMLYKDDSTLSIQNEISNCLQPCNKEGLLLKKKKKKALVGIS